MTDLLGETFVHPAFFYRGDEEYLAETTSFVREGLWMGEPVAVAVPGRRLALLREGLGSDADDVHMIDMAVAGRNPGRIIPGVLRAFADAHPNARHVRIIGEPIWAGRSATEYPACLQHEALINLAFSGRPVTILCPYDAELPATVLADAAATHPTLIERTKTISSLSYDPGAVMQACNVPVPEAGPEARHRATFDFGLDDLPRTREIVVKVAALAGFDDARVGDLEIAVNELAANSIRHGGGRGTLQVWVEQGALVCQVSDAGRLTDPLAGREPVGLSHHGGRGLLMVNYVADLVRTYSGPEGTTFQVYFTL